MVRHQHLFFTNIFIPLRPHFSHMENLRSLPLDLHMSISYLDCIIMAYLAVYTRIKVVERGSRELCASYSLTLLFIRRTVYHATE